MPLVSPPILPTEPLLAELLGPGPRSGVALYVPSQYANIQAAVNVAKYGDTIVVAPGFAQTFSVVLPSETTVKARGSYPSRPENGNPSDVLVVMGLPSGSTQPYYDLAGKTSIPPATRTLTNAAYPSGKTVMKVSNRVTHVTAGYDVNNETRATPLLPYFPIGASINFTNNRWPAYWRFVGIEFQDGFAFDTVPSIHPWNTANTQTEPHHLTWDRCFFNSDPARNASHQLCGTFVSGPVRSYIVINSTYSNFCGHTSGDAGIHAMASGSVLYFENVGAECLNFWFSGGSGGGAFYVGENISDMTFRRCHIWRPEFWLPTEPSPGVNVQPSGPYTVNIDASGLVTYVSGTPSWLDFSDTFSGQCFGPGSYIYAPSTGLARQVANFPRDPIGNGDGPHGIHFDLTAPWPGGAQTNLVIYPLYGHMVYVSGITGERAQVSGTAVTFLDAPLPATVVCEDDLTVGDRIAGRRAHYFSLASEHDASIADGANIRMVRRKIQSIAADRLSCTLASAYPTSATFPYLISPNDGALRVGEGAYSNRGKAIIEHKMGDRVLFEGNIVENFREYWRVHPSNQWEGRQTVNSMTINADGSFTVTNPAGFVLEPFMQTMVANRHANGAPWPYVAFVAGLINNPFTGAVALVDTISGASGTFKAGANNLGAQSNFGQFWNMPTPHARNQDFTIRYNWARGMQPGPSIHGNNINTAEMWHGERFSFVHNVQEDTGDRRYLGLWGASGVACYAGGEAFSAFWHGSKRSTDVWPGQSYGSDSPMQVAHNTFVRFHALGVAVIDAAPHSPNGVPQPYEYSFDLDFDANIADGADGRQMLNASGQYWTAPYSHAKNVLAGAGASANGSFPDNAILASQASIGYTNPTPDATKLPSRFRGDYTLTDIYSASCTIAGDGLSATFSTALPSHVVAGQFFRTASNATLVRIVSVVGTLVRWSTGVAPVYPVTGSQTGVITFKASAPDGTDPGANIADLTAFTAGVDSLVEPDGGPPPVILPRVLSARAPVAVF